MRHTAPAMSAPHAARPFTHSKKHRPSRVSPPNPKCAARPGHLRLTPKAPPAPGISAQPQKRRPCSAGQTLRLGRSLERAGRARCRPASQDALKPLSPAPLTPPPLKSETAAFLLSRVRSMRKFVIRSLTSPDNFEQRLLDSHRQSRRLCPLGPYHLYGRDLAPTNILRVTKASGRSCE